MLQIPIHHHFDSAHNFYHSNSSDKNITSSIRKGVFEVTKVAVAYARKMTGYKDVKVRLIEDYDVNYTGSYNFGTEKPFIKLNLAPVVNKVIGFIQSGSSSVELERFSFSSMITTMLHELGHHHEVITGGTAYLQDLNDLELGGSAFSHISGLKKSGNIPNSFSLLADKKLLEILTDSKNFIVTGERTADQYAIDILTKYQMSEVLECMKSDRFDIKNGYYYRTYSDAFLEDFSEQIFIEYFPNEKSLFQTFLDKVIYLTDEIILSRSRAARRQKLQR